MSLNIKSVILNNLYTSITYSQDHLILVDIVMEVSSDNCTSWLFAKSTIFSINIINSKRPRFCLTEILLFNNNLSYYYLF